MLYKIKPLDFGDSTEGVDRYFRNARVPFGSYSISPIPYGNYFDKVPPEGFELQYCFDEYYDEGNLGSFKTIDEAKTAANEHWVSVLSGCLESVDESKLYSLNDLKQYAFWAVQFSHRPENRNRLIHRMEIDQFLDENIF